MMQLIQDDIDIMENIDEFETPEIDILDLTEKLTSFLSKRLGKETAEYWTAGLDQELEYIYDAGLTSIQFILEELGYEDK